LTDLEQLTIIGVEDGSFRPCQRAGKTLLCSVYMQSNKLLQLRLEFITVDGMDATDKLLKMLEGLRGDAIILGGITFAGFNIIEPNRVIEKTGIPIIVYSGKKPNTESVKEALRTHFVDWEERFRIVQSLGDLYTQVSMKGWPSIYYKVIGISPIKAAGILRYSASLCRIPEPIRIASIIAKGLSPFHLDLKENIDGFEDCKH
jgi:endonuclease V-like protein UPF0215 family